MQKNPLISIIMTTYNRAGFILESINSVQHQSYDNWELIIVDDGSDDNTEQLVKNENDQRIIFVKAGRIAIGGKLKNLAIQLSKGAFIAFLDSDDCWAPEKLKIQLDAMYEYPAAGFCLCGGYNFKIPGVPEEFFYKNRTDTSFEQIFEPIFNSEITVFTQVLLMKKECLQTAGYFEEMNSFSDVDFILSLAWHYKAVVIRKPLLYRRLHENNYITDNWKKSYYQGIETIAKFRADGKLTPKLAKKALYRLYINFGEKSLLYGEHLCALNNFIKAWIHFPFSIIPFKKSMKVAVHFFTKKKANSGK